MCHFGQLGNSIHFTSDQCEKITDERNSRIIGIFSDRIVGGRIVSVKRQAIEVTYGEPFQILVEIYVEIRTYLFFIYFAGKSNNLCFGIIGILMSFLLFFQ